MPPKTKPTKAEYSIWYTLTTCVQMVWRFDKSYSVTQISLSIYDALFNFFSVYMLGYFLDLITSRSITTLNDELFLIPFIGYGLLMLFNRILNSYKQNVISDFGRRFSAFLNDMLVSKRASLELAQLDDPKTNNLSMKANDNIGKIDSYLNTVTSLQDQIFSIITALLVILPFSVVLAALNIILAIPEYFVSKKIQRERYLQYDDNVIPRRHYSNYRSYLSQAKEVREVKLGNISNYLLSVSRSIMSIIHAKEKGLDDQRFSMRVWVGLASILAFTISLYTVYTDLVTGVITIGMTTILMNQLNSLRSAFTQGFFRLNELESQSMYLQDVFKFLNMKPSLSDGSNTIPSEIKTLEFNKLSFTYPGSNKVVLHNINLSIPHGSKVAIVGENGAGKSTLTKLLLRYYDPTTGTVEINGNSLAEFKRDDWYARISYMPQDFNKYPFVLREVITLGEPADQFNQDRYDRALFISQTDKLIATLTNGDQTILSPQFEGGTELSVGQAQKVAIARVLYRPADILILDEPTSAIDAISELHIFNEIEKLPDSQTVILISHRFNTVKNADIIVVLEHGTIVESGSHDQLMNNKSRYYEMYTAQKDSYE